MKLIIFLALSAVTLITTDLYVEYMINRPFPLFLTLIAGIVLIVGFYYYLKYAAKTLKNLLNL